MTEWLGMLGSVQSLLWVRGKECRWKRSEIRPAQLRRPPGNPSEDGEGYRRCSTRHYSSGNLPAIIRAPVLMGTVPIDTSRLTAQQSRPAPGVYPDFPQRAHRGEPEREDTEDIQAFLRSHGCVTFRPI